MFWYLWYSERLQALELNKSHWFLHLWNGEKNIWIWNHIWEAFSSTFPETLHDSISDNNKILLIYQNGWKVDLKGGRVAGNFFYEYMPDSKLDSSHDISIIFHWGNSTTGVPRKISRRVYPLNREESLMCKGVQGKVFVIRESKQDSRLVTVTAQICLGLGRKERLRYLWSCIFL